jgi:DNA primase
VFRFLLRGERVFVDWLRSTPIATFAAPRVARRAA